jgi:RNA polymerase sigma-70 factor, ECF subfamily
MITTTSFGGSSGGSGSAAVPPMTPHNKSSWSQPNAFLFGTALRVARRVSRNEKRWVLEDDMDFRNSQVARPEDLADQRRAVDLMGRILANMDLDLKTVFILAELEGQTMPQVSSLLEIPLGTATSRLRRAREAFRAAVAAFEASIPGGPKS